MDKLNLCQLKEIIKQNKTIIKIYSNLNKNIKVNIINNDINLDNNKKYIMIALRLINQKVKKNQEDHIINDDSIYDTDSYIDNKEFIQDDYTSESQNITELKSQPIHSLRGLGDNKLMNRMLGEAKFREEIFTDNILKPFIEKSKQFTNNLGAKINLF
jgi:hypothetical protein